MEGDWIVMELIIAANWKMHKTAAEAAAFCKEIRQQEGQLSGVEALICPPYTALDAMRKSLEGSRIKLGAQNMFWAEKGAYTGEIAPAMLKELGVEYVILGHSERRHLFGESDTLIRKKMEAALEQGLKPILCVGETEVERDQEVTEAVLERQLQTALEGLELQAPADLVIAYEPVWAIGTGKAASADDAESAAAHVRRVASRCLGAKAVEGMRIQYGGSVKVENIGEFMALPSIHGALVGGASLEAALFSRLILAAKEAATR
jgi:triosephosphate isomerase (TIM)